MTVDEKTLVRNALAAITSQLGSIAGVPIDTGNLRRSIKVRETSTGFQVYIDEEQAPYAASVELFSPY